MLKILAYDDLMPIPCLVPYNTNHFISQTSKLLKIVLCRNMNKSAHLSYFFSFSSPVESVFHVLLYWYSTLVPCSLKTSPCIHTLGYCFSHPTLWLRVNSICLPDDSKCTSCSGCCHCHVTATCDVLPWVPGAAGSGSRTGVWGNADSGVSLWLIKHYFNH